MVEDMDFESTNPVECLKKIDACYNPLSKKKCIKIIYILISFNLETLKSH
jgi:hypothetical protein